MSHALPHVKSLELCSSSLWSEAVWAATTYRCHPQGEAPPVMGLVFANWEAGLKLFQSWTETFRHVDPNEDIRIAVIEGEIAEQDPGYTIRISSAEADRQYFGTDPQPPCQVQRLHPLPDNPDMLQDFKGQYLKHLEFLVAPVVQQNDGQLYIAYDEGIIKTECVFREVEDILDCDADAVALQSPDFDFRPSSLLDGHPPWSR